MSRWTRISGTAGGDGEDESWMTTYADAITLLMAFFVMLFTLASMEAEAYEAAVSEIRSTFQEPMLLDTPASAQVVQTAQGLTGGGARSELTQAPSRTRELLRESARQLGMRDEVKVEQRDRGLAVTFTGRWLFAPGAAELPEDAQPGLEAMATEVVARAEEGTVISVIGHTDSAETTDGGWGLGAARAAHVVAALSRRGVDPQRVRVVSHGAAQPLLENEDRLGEAILDNMAINRRVEIVVEEP